MTRDTLDSAHLDDVELAPPDPDAVPRWLDLFTVLTVAAWVAVVLLTVYAVSLPAGPP